MSNNKLHKTQVANAPPYNINTSTTSSRTQNLINQISNLD